MILVPLAPALPQIILSSFKNFFVILERNAVNIILICIAFTMQEVNHPFTYLRVMCTYYFSMNVSSCILYIFLSSFWPFCSSIFFRALELDLYHRAAKTLAHFVFCLLNLPSYFSFVLLCSQLINIFFYFFLILCHRKSFSCLVHKEIYPCFFFLVLFHVFTFEYLIF